MYEASLKAGVVALRLRASRLRGSSENSLVFCPCGCPAWFTVIHRAAFVFRRPMDGSSLKAGETV